jgi:hypothetical protein
LSQVRTWPFATSACAVRNFDSNHRTAALALTSTLGVANLHGKDLGLGRTGVVE